MNGIAPGAGDGDGHGHSRRLSSEEAGISASKVVYETVNGSHDYTIKGYSLTKGMGPGKYLTSDTSVGGHDWAIYFYPDGKNLEDNSVYVSVFIALASVGFDIRALFELTLVDHSGKGRHKVHTHFGRLLESGPYTLKYSGSMWGYKRFYRRTSLETSDFLKDDTIVMRCTVGVVRSRVEAPKSLAICIPPSNMGRCLLELLETGFASDIVFYVGEEIFKAHKIILAARSPVFHAQFYGPMGNCDTNKVTVEEVDPLVFKAMLRYVYSDEFPDLHELTGTTSMCASTIILQHLLAAADRFGLERMKRLCEANLSEQITADTVAATLALAEQHHCAQLKSVCLKFAAARENLEAVMQTNGFNHLEGACPSLLSDLLETIAVVDEEPSMSSKKRTGGRGNLGICLNDDNGGCDSDERPMRRRM